MSAHLRCAHFLFRRYLLNSRLLLITLLIFSVTTACAAPGTAAAPVGTNPAEPTGYFISVTYNGNRVAALTFDSLGKMEQISARNQEHDSTGPRLTAVLKFAGINDFSEVKISGVNRGRVATAEITLKKSQVNDTTILDMTNRGTTKLTDSVIPFESWIFDVTDIDVKQ